MRVANLFCKIHDNLHHIVSIQVFILTKSSSLISLGIQRTRTKMSRKLAAKKGRERESNIQELHSVALIQMIQRCMNDHKKTF